MGHSRPSLFLYKEIHDIFHNSKTNQDNITKLGEHMYQV